jgi:predicted O-methyltransferase YrrM
MDLEQLKTQLLLKLDKNTSSRIFLDRLRVGEEKMREMPSYNDPRHFPFYYYLGVLTTPENLVEIGFGVGFCSSLFLKGCKTVKRFLAIQEPKKDEFYSVRMGKSNLKDNFRGVTDLYVGNITDDEFEVKFKENNWQLAIINEEVNYDRYRLYFDFLWPQMDFEGLIIIGNILRHRQAKQAYIDFCKVKNREFMVIETRSGIGIIKK